LLAIGLHIVLDGAGMLHLGFVCFFAAGAYATGLLTGATIHLFTGSTEPAVMGSLSFSAAVPIVMLLGAALSVLLGAPALRLPGGYLALVTLAAGGTVTVLISSAWLEPLLGGPAGMRDITDAAIGSISFRDPRNFVYLVTAFVVVAAFVSRRLTVSRIGPDWAAIRNDERRAEAGGVRTVRAELAALAAGGAVGSLAGALFAVKVGSLTPATFGATVSIQVLAIVVLGGPGGLPGVIAAAAVLIGIPSLSSGFGEYRWLVYGAVIVVTMMARHHGRGPTIGRDRGRPTHAGGSPA
jgi:branched-chain amino acid transport system permease protein